MYNGVIMNTYCTHNSDEITGKESIDDPKFAGEKYISLGKKIRSARQHRGVSLVDLAKDMGISPQQLTKYETGINRIPALRLKEIADKINVKINYFFEDLSNNGGNL